MNKIYKVIFSRTLARFIVVSEFTKSEGKAKVCQTAKTFKQSAKPSLVFKALMGALTSCTILFSHAHAAVHAGNSGGGTKAVLAWGSGCGGAFINQPAMNVTGGVAVGCDNDMGVAVNGALRTTVIIPYNADPTDPSTWHATTGLVVMGQRNIFEAEAGHLSMAGIMLGRSNKSINGNSDILIGGSNLIGPSVNKGIDQSGGANIAIGLANKIEPFNANDLLWGNIVMGHGATIKSDSGAIGVGLMAKSQGKSAIALGAEASALNDNAVALGSSSEATGEASIASGYQAQATGYLSTAIGSQAQVRPFAHASTAIGYNAQVLEGHENSVALGSDSIVDRDSTAETENIVDGITFGNFAGVAKFDSGVVSVGQAGVERQVIHVAAGKVSVDSTDAINGSQLFVTNQVIANAANSTAGILGGNAIVKSDGELEMTDVGNTGKNTVHDAIQFASQGWVLDAGDPSVLAPGDVVTLNNTDGKIDITQNGSNVTFNLTADNGLKFVGDSGGDILKMPGDTLEIIGGVQGDLSTGNIGVVAKDSKLNIALAQDLTGLSSATFGSGAQTAVLSGTGVTVGGTALTQSGLALVGGPSVQVGGIDAGALKITGVAAGTAADHAVNLGQLTQASTELTSKGVKFAGNTGLVHRDLGQTLTVTGTGSTSGTYSGDNLRTVADASSGAIQLQLADSPTFGGITINDSGRITGVAAGVAGTDAVNVAQLEALEGSLSDTGLKFGGNAGAVHTAALGSQVTIRGATSNTDWSQFDGGANLMTEVDSSGNINLGLAQDLTGLSSATFGSGAQTAVLSGTGVTVGGTALTQSGLALAGGPSVQVGGIDAGALKITGVASGGALDNVANHTNAANIGDLAEAIANIKIGATGSFALTDQTGGSIKQNLGSAIKVIGDAAGNITTQIDTTGDALTISLNEEINVTTVNTTNLKVGDSFYINEDGAFYKGDLSNVDDKYHIVNKEYVDSKLAVGGVSETKYGANQGDIITINSGDSLNIIGGTNNDDWSKFDAGQNIMTHTDGKNNVSIALAKDIEGLSSATFVEGENKTVINSGGVSVSDVALTRQGLIIEGGPSVTASGIDAGNYQIDHVAPATRPHQAVNLEQVSSMISKARRDARGGTAAALAAAALPQAYLPGKNSFAVSGSTYGGHAGYAMGLSRISENGKWIIKGQVSGSDRSDMGAAVGVAVQW